MHVDKTDWHITKRRREHSNLFKESLMKQKTTLNQFFRMVVLIALMFSSGKGAVY